MRTVFITALTFLSTTAFAQQSERPWHLYGEKLNVSAEVFQACFSGVTPDSNHAPNGATQRANKAILLPCLQAENPSISNSQLDAVMDSLRPEGPMHKVL